MKLSDFLQQVLSLQLTLNEITVLIELGYKEFAREDLLSSNHRVHTGTYSASVLTRTLQKLANKNPAIISVYQNSKDKTVYSLVTRPEAYNSYEPILLQLAHSKLMTLNTMRVALQLVVNDNKPSTSRCLGQQLNLTPDYLASSVLPRMFIIGLLKKDSISSKKLDEIMYIREDIPADASEPNPNLLVFSLNLEWKGCIDEIWL